MSNADDTPAVGTVDAADVDGLAMLLVDVREQDEWDAGHAPDAVHIPLGAVMTGWVPDPPVAVVAVICRSGARSARAAAMLASQGVASLNVVGGMRAWDAAGRIVVGADHGPGLVI